MKKMFVIVAMFVAASMVACCGEQKAKEAEGCCEKTECCAEKAECKGECTGECAEKAECEKECCGDCKKAEEAPAEAPAEEAAPAPEA